jgi:hypothetical protein
VTRRRGSADASPYDCLCRRVLAARPPSPRERGRIALALLGTVIGFGIALTALAATRGDAVTASVVQVQNQK